MDSNQKAIKLALEAHGCKVLSLAPLGGGAPDLLVMRRNYPRWVMLEVKSPGPPSMRKLTPAEAKFHAQWPVIVVQSVEEALQALGLV